MAHILLTGFPGFLASRLLPRLLRSAPGDSVVCVVAPGMAEAARAELARLRRDSEGVADQVRLVEGDISRPGVLAVGEDAGPVTQLFHVAALYHLGVAREPAFAVNVLGTRHMLALARSLPLLKRVDYVSTCYVSGRHEGEFREVDLDVGQPFANHYEETKFLAEVAVREAQEEGLPVAIHRPAIVVGDSRTGKTPKFDGPYYLMGWMAAQGGRFALVPRPPGLSRGSINVVPVDFVTDAMAALSKRPESLGRTFHLADPAPLNLPDFVAALSAALKIRPIWVPMPLSLAGHVLQAAGRLPGFPEAPREGAQYLSHPSRYQTEETRTLLAKDGIRVPAFSEYVDRLVEYFRESRRS